MKRTIIRILGIGLATVQTFIGRDCAAGVTTIDNRVNVSVDDTTRITGYVAYIADGSNSAVFADAYTSDTEFDSLAGCPGHSKTNGTGVYCSYTGYFDSKGCIYDWDSTYTGYGCIYKNAEWSEVGYSFYSCLSGYYTVADHVEGDLGFAWCFQNPPTGNVEPTVYTMCCKPCPQFVNVQNVGTGISGTTIANNNKSPIFEQSGWAWGPAPSTGTGLLAPENYGVASCYAWMTTGEYSDARGTYEIGPCPYVE